MFSTWNSFSLRKHVIFVKGINKIASEKIVWAIAFILSFIITYYSKSYIMLSTKNKRVNNITSVLKSPCLRENKVSQSKNLFTISLLKIFSTILIKFTVLCPLYTIWCIYQESIGFRECVLSRRKSLLLSVKIANLPLNDKVRIHPIHLKLLF